MSAAVAPLAETTGLPREASQLAALFVLNNLSVGGSEVKIVRLVNDLQQRGVNAGVCYLNEPHQLRDSLHPDVPVWCLERRGKFSLAATRALRRLIVERDAQVVFAVNSYPTLYVAAATRGLARKPRTVVLMNTTDYPAGEEWRRHVYQRVMRLLDLTVYGCELQRDRWEGQSPRSTSIAVYNGVDAERFSVEAIGDAGHRFREKLGIASGTFLIGGIGRLVPEKNHRVLIDALIELRRRGIDAHGVIAGKGPCREMLEQRASNVKEHVSFTGVLEDVRPLLAALDVFVLPSIAETFSNAALEAMSMSRPVVLSTAGGSAEMIDSGCEGFLIAPSTDPDELIRTLMSLHGQPALRARMGESARARVLRQFSWQSMVRSYEELLHTRSVVAHG